MRKSPKRIEAFKIVQREESEDTKNLVPFDIRWISFSSSVSCIIDVYSSFILTLWQLQKTKAMSRH